MSDIQMWTIWCGLVTQECGHPTGKVHTHTYMHARAHTQHSHAHPRTRTHAHTYTHAYAHTHTHSWASYNHIIHYYIKYLLKVQIAVGVDPALPYNHVDN